MTAEQVGILVFLVFAGGALLKIVLKFRRGHYTPPHDHDFWGGCGGSGCGGGCGGGG